MAHTVLRQILTCVKACKYYAILVDEATDISSHEQVSICLRYVSSESMEVHENFVGLHETGDTTAETLTIIIKDALLRFGLEFSDCRGQAYDGASNMSGRMSGVQARISAENPKAIYVHCLNHSLNLAVQDTSKRISLFRNTLNVIQEISNLIRFRQKEKHY